MLFPRPGSVRDLHGERLPIVQLALLDPLKQVFARQLRVHSCQVRVCPFRRARNEFLESLQCPFDRNGRVQELDSGCTGEQGRGGAKENGATMKSAARANGANHTPGSQAAAITHAQ